MPYPQEYQLSTFKFQEFLDDVKKNCDFGSNHMAYTVAQGVLQVFRKRLSLKESIAFANLLPVGLRALFIADWDLEEERGDFNVTRRELIHEVQSLRKDHNFTYLTDDPIAQVAKALKKQVDLTAFNTFLSHHSLDATNFWES